MTYFEATETWENVLNQRVKPLELTILHTLDAGHLPGKKLAVRFHHHAPCPPPQGFLQRDDQRAGFRHIIRGLTQGD